MIKWTGLLEEANDLGYSSIEDAINDGQEITYKDGSAHLTKKEG